MEVTIEGVDEDTAAAELQKFFRENPRRRPARQSLEGRKWKNILENPVYKETAIGLISVLKKRTVSLRESISTIQRKN